MIVNLFQHIAHLFVKRWSLLRGGICISFFVTGPPLKLRRVKWKDRQLKRRTYRSEYEPVIPTQAINIQNLAFLLTGCSKKVEFFLMSTKSVLFTIGTSMTSQKQQYIDFFLLARIKFHVIYCRPSTLALSPWGF